MVIRKMLPVDLTIVVAAGVYIWAAPIVRAGFVVGALIVSGDGVGIRSGVQKAGVV